MKSFIAVSVLLLLLVVVPPLIARGQLEALVDAAGTAGFSLGRPFGGQIVLVRPCYNFSALHVVVGPPVPGSFIYQMGVSRSYLNGPPFRTGQWLLGMAGGTAICDIDPGKVFNGQGGDLILFHGSSL